MPRISLGNPPLFTLKPTEPGNVLMSAIQRFYAEGKLTDVKVSYQNNVLFTCHKVILSSFSSYFESLLLNTEGCAILSLNDQNQGDCAKLMRLIVNFMYGYNIEIPRANCPELIEVAKMFGVTALVKALETQMQRTPLFLRPDDVLVLKPTAISCLILVSFQRFRAEKKFIDAKIGFNDEQYFPCHKLILASFSSYFETLLQGTESSTMLSLEAVDPLYVRQLPLIFDYMYGDTLKLTEQQIVVLGDAARVFGIHSLEVGELAKLKQKAKKQQQQRMINQRLRHLRQKDTSPISGLLSKNDVEVIRQGWLSNNTVPEQVEFSLTSDNSTKSFESAGESDESLKAARESTISLSMMDDSVSNQTEHERSPLLSDAAAFPSTSNLQDFPSRGNIYSPPPSTSTSEQLFDDTLAVPCVVEEEFVNEGHQGQYMCQECGRLFRSTQSLDTHMNSKHKKANKKTKRKRRWFCALCGFSADTVQDLKNHVAASHDGSNKICSLCLLPLKSRKELLDHMKKNHKTKLLICEKPNCSKLFQTQHGLRCHMQTHETGFECEICEITVRNRAALTDHKKSAHNLSADGSDAVKKHQCEECGSNFLYRSLLDRHFQKVHLKVKPFQCPYCKHATSEKGALHTHIRCVHTREKPFQCKNCQQRFSTQSHLARHKRLKHGTERHHLCTVCGETFTDKRDYDVHVTRDHKKERPFSCPECSQGFFRKDHLLVHRRKIHGVAV